MCFQAQWPWPELFFMWFLTTRFGWSQLSSSPAPAAEMLNFPGQRESKDGIGPSCGSPPAHTGMKGEGFLLGQSRHIASLKIVPSSELSILIWRLTPLQCNGSGSHKWLCAWLSSHTNTNNIKHKQHTGVCFGWSSSTALRWAVMATPPQTVRTAAAFTAAGCSQSKPSVSSCMIIVFQALLQDSQQNYGMCAPSCRTDLYLRGEEGFSQLCSIPQGLQGISLVNEVMIFKAEAWGRVWHLLRSSVAMHLPP